MNTVPNQARRFGIEQGGFSLLEILVSASLLIIVFFGLAQIYHRGRVQLDFEEDRRKATAVAQERLDGLRRDYRYDTLPALNGTDTTYVADGRTYVVSQFIDPHPAETHALRCSLVVKWQAKTQSGPVDRSLEVTSFLGRGMP